MENRSPAKIAPQEFAGEAERLACDLSRQPIADRIGLTVATVSRTLG